MPSIGRQRGASATEAVVPNQCVIAITQISRPRTQIINGGVQYFGEADMVLRAVVRVATETIVIVTVIALALPFLVVLTVPFIRL